MSLNSLMRICTIIGIVFIFSVLCQDATQNVTENTCTSLSTCGKCIASDGKCAWCKQDKDDRDPRCDLVYNLLKTCNENDIVNPDNEMTINQNDPLTTPGSIRGNKVVQIAPQHVTLRLRPGRPHNLKVTFRQAEDYPVDLYYLMDLSKSMEDDKEKLALLGDLLAEEMSKITKNFQLGFGSFVDKVVMPYVSTVPEKLKEPCEQCAEPYGFRNEMKLSVKTNMFMDKVKGARVSGNLDAPEGGFDAIMQSIVCEEEIGWRNESRKLLVFSTDSSFHYAGDGKLGGIVKPNDGKCHLDKTGLYTESTNMDYPSISQLNQKAKEKQVVMIFAVTGNQVSVYNQLSNNLESATTGELANDSSNIVDLIKNQYDKITSFVKLMDDAKDKHVQVSYYSKCLDNTKESENTKECQGLKIGTKVEFDVMIEVKSCPEDPKDWHQTFKIYPSGLSESLIVDLHMICECDCTRPENVEKNSRKCNGTGTYQCGICACNPKRHGRYCECDENTKREEDESLCKASDSNQICSGRGECVCGKCECFTNKKGWESIYGTYCECNNYACDRNKNIMCNGHGECVCNVCKCHRGWSGSACECRTGVETCIAPGANTTCSGKGKCVCGECRCNEGTDGSKISGEFCDDCPSCGTKCAVYRSCVQCKAFKSGEFTEEECANATNCPVEPMVVDKAEVEKTGENLCVFRDVDDCKFTFVYGYDGANDNYIRVQRTKDCPPPVNVLMIVMGVVGGIVAIGLCLLLIWKLLTTIHDRKEFAKFEEERRNAKWETGENPIFKGAVSNFNNPMYGTK